MLITQLLAQRLQSPQLMLFMTHQPNCQWSSNSLLQSADQHSTQQAPNKQRQSVQTPLCTYPQESLPGNTLASTNTTLQRAPHLTMQGVLHTSGQSTVALAVHHITMQQHSCSNSGWSQRKLLAGTWLSRLQCLAR